MLDNKVACEIFGSSFIYDEANNGIYHYPCDDLHGMFSGNDCNCMTHRKRSYLSQEDIDERIIDYLQPKKSNKVAETGNDFVKLFSPSVFERYMKEIIAKRPFEVSQNTPQSVDSDSSPTQCDS